MFNRLFTNWKKSKAHLLLLSKFLGGNASNRYEQDERWQAALDEPPSAAIKRFLGDGVLGPADTAHVLAACYTAIQLKDLLRVKELKISGKKEELIARLIEHDQAGMAQLAQEHDILTCIGAGEQIARDFLESESRKKEELEQTLVSLVEKNNFRTAADAVADYEATQVFPRGLGIDWSQGGAFMEEVLRDIYGCTPSILRAVGDSELRQLRMAAAMMELTGENRGDRWLPDNFELGIAMECEAAARMLLFHAYHLRRMRQYQRGGVRKVQVSGVNDAEQCAACRDIDGKVYPLNELPEFPYPKCTCEMGCRCTTVSADFK